MKFKFSDENLNLIKNIRIDTEKNTIKTPLGECEYEGEIKASDEQKLLVHGVERCGL